MRSQNNPDWADYVARVMKKHGATLRSQRQRTGLSHTTVSSWLQGVNPGYDGAVAFADGFGEDVHEALRLAGYQPINPADPVMAAEQLLASVKNESGEELTYDPDIEHVDVYGFEGAESMTENDRRIINVALRALIEAQRRKQGREGRNSPESDD